MTPSSGLRSAPSPERIPGRDPSHGAPWSSRSRFQPAQARTSSLRGRRSISLKRQVLRTRRPTGLDRATPDTHRSRGQAACVAGSASNPQGIVARRPTVQLLGLTILLALLELAAPALDHSVRLARINANRMAADGSRSAAFDRTSRVFPQPFGVLRPKPVCRTPHPDRLRVEVLAATAQRAEGADRALALGVEGKPLVRGEFSQILECNDDECDNSGPWVGSTNS